MFKELLKKKEYAAETLCGEQRQKYLLSGPLWKCVADPYVK